MSANDDGTVNVPSGSGFASPDIPIAGENGEITPDWYRQLVELYQHSGLAMAGFKMWTSTVVNGCSIIPDDVSPPTLATFVSPTKLYSFDDSTICEGHGAITLPGDYVDGTDLYPFARWAPSSTSTGVCRWSLDYTVGKEGSAFGSNVSENIFTAGSGTVNKHQVTEWSLLDGETLKSGDAISFRIKRLGNGEDDLFSGDAFLLAVGFHHLVGVPGRNGRVR